MCACILVSVPYTDLRVVMSHMRDGKGCSGVIGDQDEKEARRGEDKQKQKERGGPWKKNVTFQIHCDGDQHCTCPDGHRKNEEDAVPQTRLSRLQTVIIHATTATSSVGEAENCGMGNYDVDGVLNGNKENPVGKVKMTLTKEKAEEEKKKYKQKMLEWKVRRQVRIVSPSVHSSINSSCV